ncbi:MAG: DUF2914 domain-containing protein [Deltaproteobacteria bacterium]|nr:DUF2914 domain-containing protein [Deltaproteobacteria bacterium]MBW2142282.1 DUF2914 domain-containing protein [Deltaproteobacteria bacterium]MBW2324659.1 DUF2914 domain-containing protein [Deltaproteobacteria bacterium]
MKNKWFLSFLIFFITSFAIHSQASAEEIKEPPSASTQKTLILTQALICESIKTNGPQNEAVVFSIQIGEVKCFTVFNPVPEKTFIYHKWFHKDKLSTKRKLSIKPPQWETYSRIQLREADKGPWRVEITDSKGKLLRVLRFSITD